MAKQEKTIETLELELAQAKALIEQLKRVIQIQEGQIQAMKAGAKIPAKETQY